MKWILPAAEAAKNGRHEVIVGVLMRDWYTWGKVSTWTARVTPIVKFEHVYNVAERKKKIMETSSVSKRSSSRTDVISHKKGD